jgi:hypothetical protein
MDERDLQVSEGEDGAKENAMPLASCAMLNDYLAEGEPYEASETLKMRFMMIIPRVYQPDASPDEGAPEGYAPSIAGQRGFCWRDVLQSVRNAIAEYNKETKTVTCIPEIESLGNSKTRLLKPYFSLRTGCESKQIV